MAKPHPRALPQLNALAEPEVSHSIAEAEVSHSIDESGDATEAGDRECQLCFDSDSSSLPVCGPECSTNVCVACLELHIRVSLSDTVPGILPRVRCPGCLQRLPSSAWVKRVSSDVSLQYRSLCEKACAYLPPCCHNEQYTQLPEPHDSSDGTPGLEDVVDSALHHKLTAFRAQVARFETHRLTPRELIRSIEELLLDQQATDNDRNRLVDHVLSRLHDDERRAALLLAYHSIHKRVTTRCCSVDVCFNCKRRWNSDHMSNPDAPCDNNELTQDEILRCRACRVLIVKVEGCSSVLCACGFSMHWGEELWTRDQNARQLIPADVDVYDIEGFRRWDDWQRAIKSLVVWEMEAGRVAFRLRQIDAFMRPHRPLLRRMAQSYVWWKRFKMALPALERELHTTRLAFLLRKLQRSEPFRHAVQDKRQGYRWKVCMRSIRSIPRYNEETITAQECKLLVGLFGEE